MWSRVFEVTGYMKIQLLLLRQVGISNLINCIYQGVSITKQHCHHILENALTAFAYLLSVGYENIPISVARYEFRTHVGILLTEETNPR